MKYDKVIIYYFSGTGNAKNAAKWIQKTAEENGLETQLINIDRFETIVPPALTEKTLIGFCSPTHGFNLPPLALKFIQKFPKTKKIDAFILNTRGGLKLFKLFLPGISGMAQLLPAIMLCLKGYRIVAMQPLDLPSNWLILHPSLNKKTVDAIYNRCRGIVKNFTQKMLSGKKNYNALFTLPLDIILLPITVLYYIIGRFFLAKTLIATDACDTCMKCILQCPVKAISLVNGRPYWSFKCESCMRCVNACHTRAIETMQGFAAYLIFMSLAVISPLLILLLKNLDFYEQIQRSWFTQKTWALVNAFIFLAFVFINYHILHYLMRYRFFNKIIAYTSLSKYKFWNRYHPPKN